MSDITNLKILKETKSIIDNLVKNHGGLQRDYIHKMAVFFQNTGTNPDTFIMPSPAEELKKFRDTIIGFLRKQEADFIKPTFGKMNSTMEMMVQYLEFEAPKKEEKKELKTTPIVTDKLKKPLEQNQNEDALIADLKNELLRKEQQIALLKDNFLKVCSSVEKRSTGMNKRNVILMDEAEYRDIYNWLKTFEI